MPLPERSVPARWSKYRKWVIRARLRQLESPLPDLACDAATTNSRLRPWSLLCFHCPSHVFCATSSLRQRRNHLIALGSVESVLDALTNPSAWCRFQKA
ncbi:hypothetical protein K469DRAFT_155027 [Zopfia rhizophila CBS 207.26]|uniref:Uncharacterized protein n=1 Tax=Zopfia rhizophila CBS 207.26 TaxID=1314779 RepID=A0A6A6E3G0_9PEZI|nr:hypothetical protein K469DRAFT_155027 [Zopfia rhizophila CBS 207.26]